MRAVTIQPLRAGSLRLEERPDPVPRKGELLARTVAIGVCGTDRELIEGRYGEAPPGHARLLLGHESLARVVEAPAASGFAPGDMMVGIVRHADPEPCANCAVGEWDMCTNGGYTERGINRADGFAGELFTADPAMAVKVNASLGIAAVLLEPASIVAKAWEHIERIGRRALWQPRRALITGAGPVGLLAMLLGVQRGLEVHVLDRNRGGPKSALVAEAGATYHTAEPDLGFDVVLECTGAEEVIRRVLRLDGDPNQIVCLAGLGAAHAPAAFDLQAFNRALVLGNRVVFGSVNANRRHYLAAAAALARADRGWLERLITRRVPLEAWREAYERRPGDVKTVLTFAH